MSQPPNTVSVTFLFTDIEGSTRLWEERPEAMRVALARHDALTREAVESNGGRIVKTSGDGLHAAFADAQDAVRAALAIQHVMTAPLPATPAAGESSPLYATRARPGSGAARDGPAAHEGAAPACGASAGVSLAVRCGLHVGMVEARDGDYFGRAVNRAARVMTAAHGGQVLVTRAVAEAVGDGLPGHASLLDLGQVRLRDLAEPEHVFQLAHPDLRRDFPPLRSLESTPNNLPQRLSSFVGREVETAQIAELLAQTRLVTLHGVGGLGKTRLAVQAAAGVLDEFPDGVWLIELAPIADPTLIPQLIATTLGVREEAGRSLEVTLAAHLKPRRMLLVLDNCEHMVRSCARLVRQLLEATTQLHVVATSREPLAIAGEHVYALPTFAIPALGATPDVAALGRIDAIRLFAERAAAIDPTFRVGADNAVAVAEICRRLDGIPLAIELAAARVRALSIEAIQERLGKRFRLLTRGDAAALPRQQTLRALLDWSHDLLEDGERAMFRRLAVFAGGWTLEAAEAVCAGDPIVGDESVDLLAQLVEKSLVARDAGGARYRLLETMREYAQEKLAAAGEESAVRARHLGTYLALAEAARPQLMGPRQGEWLARLDADRENLLAAHAWCDQAEDGAHTGLRLVSSIKIYWVIRGPLGLGMRMTQEALARPGAQSRDLARCRALNDAGQLGFFMGRYEEVAALLEESLTIARELDDPKRIAGALQPLGMTYLGLGELERARALLTEALDRAQSLGDARDVAAASNALAQLHRVEGALDKAAPLYDRVVVLARQLGDEESIAIGLLNLCMVALGRGQGEGVAAMLREVIAISDRTGSQVTTQSVLDVCTGLAALRGEHERAAEFHAAAEALGRLGGLKRDPADAAFVAAAIVSVLQAIGQPRFDAALAAAPVSDGALPDTARHWLDVLSRVN